MSFTVRFIKSYRTDLKLYGNQLEITGYTCTVSLKGAEYSPYLMYVITNEIGSDFPSIDLTTLRSLPSKNMTTIQFTVPGKIPRDYVCVFHFKKLDSLS